MPRTVSRETLAKIDFVKGLHASDKSLTRRALNAAVKKKFKTGLAFGHMANVLDGGRRPIGVRAVAGVRVPESPAARRTALARLAKVTDRIFSGSPAFLVVVGGDRTLRVRSADSKAAVKSEIARLVTAGARPGDIRVYTREEFTVETRPIVNL